eukprot:NODE_1767_length_1818_cov_38.396460_g1497_i0.p1 GENE.NODE_1767_length_1818_cov_38.396460_g1497_i0~~NODE_1767_length_1818_cov_38.396460_g1497_i0.p1  ORF type:complete len:544 (+),score=166.93 NODE_1767_length_1818_cov_38.396460_g1497_i0:70-1701(+)
MEASNDTLIKQWTEEGLTQREIEERIFDLEERRIRQQERKELGLSSKPKEVQRKDDDFDEELDATIRTKHKSKEEKKKRKEEKQRKKEERRLRKELERQKELEAFAGYEGPLEEDDEDQKVDIKKESVMVQEKVNREHSPPPPVTTKAKTEPKLVIDEENASEKWVEKQSEAEESEVDFADEEEMKLRRPITIEKLQRIQITRKLIEQFIGQPFFLDLITGCFVRIWIGNNLTNQPVYRLCRVIGIETKPALKYKVGCVYTQDLLIVEFGKSRKSWRMDRISNSPVTPEEFGRWVQQLEEDKIPMVIIRDYQSRKEAFDKALNWTYTEEEINKMVEQRQRLQPDEFLNLAHERIRLRFRLDVLRSRGLQDSQEYEETEAKLNRLVEVEEKRLEAKTEPWQVLVRQTARNRLQNEAIQYQRILNPVSANQNPPEFDVYARIRTQPQIYWWTGGDNEEIGSGIRGAANRQKDDELGIRKDKGGLSAADAAELLSEIHSTILIDDLEMDDFTTARPKQTTTKVTRAPTKRQTATLSLREYKRLKAA